MSLIGKVRPLAKLLQNNGKVPLMRVSQRNGGGGPVHYRNFVVKETPRIKYVGEAFSFFLWYWILYHTYYQWDHLVGHDMPNPRKYTNEELGIPADDE